MAGRALLTRSILNRLIGSLPRPLAAAASTFQHVRSMGTMPRPFQPSDGTPRAVTMIPGDGIGPLVTDAVEEVMKAMDAPIHFERFDNVRGDMECVPEDVLDSIRKNKVCLKGPLLGDGGVSSPLNTQLRKELDLFASVVNCASLPSKEIPNRVDIAVISESSESGDQESFKLCSERMPKYAFEYAYLNKIESITAVHKGSDGSFLESCRKVATNYPRRAKRGWPIEYSERTVDEYCNQLNSGHSMFEVMVTPYIYADLVANAAADCNEVTSVMTQVNVGADHAIFEECAAAGSNLSNEKLVAENKANPMGLLLSTALLLRHLHFHIFADLVESAVKDGTLCLLEIKYPDEDIFTTHEAVYEVINNLDHYRISRFSSGNGYNRLIHGGNHMRRHSGLITDKSPYIYE